MKELNERPHHKIFSARRLTLLGSAAVLGSAIVLSGPLGYGPLAGNNAFAAMPVSTQQGPNGFADLVTKVKPSVISVRVRVDESAGGKMLNRDGEDQDLPQSFKGTPFEKFFHEYGFENGPQMPQRQQHQMVTGVGSGFFISADGYAVTN